MRAEKNVFEQFVDDAQSLITLPQQALSDSHSAASASVLNGYPYSLYRQQFPLKHRQLKGTFFSGDRVTFVLQKIMAQMGSDLIGPVVDPTCGMGDLLLAYANTLPLRKSLSATLSHWGDLIYGIELEPELVRLSKIRLAMLARYKGNFTDTVPDLDLIFPRIRLGDAFDNRSIVADAQMILLNPPFTQTSILEHGEWGTGLVNSAAVFLEYVLENLSQGSSVLAVLPEVLRCGARYEKFRQMIKKHKISGTYRPMGKFDTWTDVDVFISHLARSENVVLWPPEKPRSSTQSITNFFDVRVGAVVPHRLNNRGSWKVFACAKSTPRFSLNHTPIQKVRFSGTVFDPPFVVVRRTSSPTDKCRAVASIIVGDRPVAVENHLYVLSPREPSLDLCKSAVSVLSSDNTNDFLNRNMRCRHLTKSAIEQIPWSR